MNKTDSTPKNLKLRPSIKMLIIDNIYATLVLMVMFVMCGYDNPHIKYASLAVTAVIVLYLLYRIGYYRSIYWEISSTQIKSVEGLLTRNINYTELFRIIDFVERQSFLQQIIGLKDVYIISGDRTHPRLRIFGISSSVDLISIIKPLVQKQKKDNHIYEITNQ